MKRFLIFMAAILLLVMLSGCRAEKPEPLRVVTQVDVACDRGYQIMRRQYTKPEKVSMVLNYLRLQKNLGPPNVDPDLILGNRMQIDVTLSDGTHRLYYQHSGVFLSEMNQKWHEIDPKLASNFDFRLQMIPTDKKSPCPWGRGNSQLKGEECGDHSQHHSRQQVCNPDVLVPY